MDANGNLELLLARALEARLEGEEPDLALLAGEPGLQARLATAYRAALRFLPQPDERYDALDSIPRRLGTYAIEGTLGRGGMGLVLLARHEVLGRRVAIKILPRPYALVSEHSERFRREALAMARVRHPSVLSIHEVGSDSGIPFVVLQYAEGGSLEAVLQKLRGLDWSVARQRGEALLSGIGSYEARVAALLAPVADALQALHTSGIVHRDVKPSNILLDEAGRPLLGDFGLARQEGMDSLTVAGLVVGTRHYLAPELTSAEGEATPASDVYALGATLYEFLTLRAPFTADEQEELFREIREREPRPPRALNRRVSSGLEAVCLRALEKAPLRRYASAGELAKDLRAAAMDAPVLARGRSRVRVSLRQLWYRRQWILKWSLVALLGLTAILVTREWRRVEAADRTRDFVDSFQEAESLLAFEVSEYSPSSREQRERAFKLFVHCAGLVPESLEAELRAADMAMRMGEKEEAERWMARAEAHGAGSFYLDRLRRELRGEPPLPASVPSRSEMSNWRAIDLLDLASVLVSQSRRLEAFEILALIPPQSLLLPEAQIAVVLQRDALPNPPAPQTIFKDASVQVRFALANFDRFLEKRPGDPAMTYNRVVTIRDALQRGLVTGDDPATLLREVAAYFARGIEERGDAESTGGWIKTMGVTWSLHIERDASLGQALELIERLSDEHLLSYAWPDYSAVISTLVIGRRYERALGLLKVRLLQGVPIPGSFATLANVRWLHASYDGIEPDSAGIEALLALVSDELSPEDRKVSQDTLELLVGLESGQGPQATAGK